MPTASFLDLLLWSSAGYLLGSLSTAVIICRLWGVGDPRREGSQNAGATNVLRIGGRLPALLTLLGDVLKGVIPPLAAHSLGADPHVIAAAGIAAVVGHLLPVYHGFQGGKGVATGLGVLSVWYWPSAVVFAVVWLLTAAITRYASLASMLGCLLGAMCAAAFSGLWGEPVMLLTAFILYRHRHNLRNLREGREPRIGMP